MQDGFDATGTDTPGEPLAFVRRTGLLRVPFIRNALRRAFDAALAEHGPEGVFQPHVVWVSDFVADAWPMISRSLPHPPGRGLYALPPDQVPPAPDTAPDDADLVFVWLEDHDGTVAVCCAPGRVGVLEAGEAEAYLPLVRAAAARDQVVAATSDISHATPATVRVVPNRGLRAGTTSRDG